MISYLKGTVLSKAKQSIVLFTAGGVGYEVLMNPIALVSVALNSQIELFTYLRITDQSHELYGFRSTDERSFFSLLISVSGVGPKSAMNVLSVGSPDQIKDAIARGDVTYLTAVQGLGKKTAERLVVELKTKVIASGRGVDDAPDGSVLGEVVEALVSLGYSQEEARRITQMLSSEDKTSEALLKEALQQLHRN